MANLPADLPENWTRGQLVSPNGTEVGLTTQHGYNYLMAQVNAAQTAINNIVESLGEVAQETSVQDILSLIGATADTGATDTTGTLMGKSNAIISSLMNGMAVKSIQTISIPNTTACLNSDSANLYYSIMNIGSVNIDKTIVLYSTPASTNSGSVIYSGNAILTNNNTLHIYANYFTSGPKYYNRAVTIFVVEFW